MGIPGWGLGRLLTPPVMYMQEEEEESEMGVKEENEEECQGQAEARTVSSKEKNITRGEEEELRDEGVTGSREVLEDDVLTWWNEALASQDSVLTVLELPREGDEQVGGASEEKVKLKFGSNDDFELGNLSNMSGDIKKEEDGYNARRREDFQTPKIDTKLMETRLQKESHDSEQKGSTQTPHIWDTTGVTDSQLLAMLASKHCYECTSTSTLDWTDYEEEEERGLGHNEEDYEDEMGEVVSASLHIPLYSPVQVRTVVQFGGREELDAPLSPLTLLSRRLAQRLKGSRGTISPPNTPDLSTLEATWLHAVATQTSCTSSTATLRSPVPPMRQQFSPRASAHFYTAPSSPILVTPVPHRRMEEEDVKTKQQDEEATQRAEEVRMRKLKKVLAKEEKERQTEARRRREREEEEARKLEEQWKTIQCSPCTKCKQGKQTKGKGKKKARKKDVKEEKDEKKPVMHNIFFSCFKTPPCMA